ncbi:MAG TPA: SdrD B-like domain-containing protein, partial [Humisphaera sp.]
MFWNRRRRPGTRPGSVPSARAATPRAAAVPPPPVVAAARAAAEALETRWYLASVAGYVYNDLDANGSRDGSEPGLAGYEVVLSDGSSEPLSCTTDGDGRYAFTALPTGQTFSLSVAPSAPFHATSASSATVYLGGEGDFGGPEFGWSAASSASGTVVFDLDGTGTYSAADASVGDVRVYADTNLNGQYDEGEASTLTAADGTFELGNIPLPPPMSSVYIGVVAPDGWSASAWGGNVFDPGTSASGIVFGCMSSVSGWVSGAVYDDANANGANDAEAGLDGLTVTLTAANGYTASTSTSMGGQYWFGGLTARTYTITVTSPDNWNPTTSNLVAATVTGSSPSPSAPAVGLNYRPLPAPVAHVSGTVYDDRDADGARQAGEPGLAGVAVYATEVGWSGADGYGAMYYAYTDGDGRYAFDNLSPNGDYQITVAGPSDRRPTSGSGSAYVYSVPAGAPGVTGIDQGWTRGMITGYAADSANGWPWLPGIPVTLTDSTGQTVGTAVTDASGAYRFTDLDPYGSYYVAGAEVAGYRATGPVGPVTLYGGDLTGYATVYMVPAPVTASGAVYEDVDGDFLVGAGDSASSGWTVYADENGNGLRDGGEPWAVTGEDGTYALSNLLAAYTMIRLEPRAGWNDPSLTQQMGQGAFYGSVAGLNIFVRRPPATPTGLAAAATSAGVAVAWADQSSNETGFEVQRAADAAFAQGVQSFATGATAYADETTAGTRRYYYRVRAVNAGGASAWSPAAALVTPPRGAATLPDFPDGFPTGANATAAGAGLALNGGASVDPATGDLRVVPGTPGWTQAGSAWFARRVDVTRFDTTFRFTAGGDGLAFVVQAHAPEAIGNPVGGDMGYQGIPDSVAVKIDTGWGYWSYNNTTGLYVGGQPPTNPEVSLAAGVDPTAGHPC